MSHLFNLIIAFFGKIKDLIQKLIGQVDISNIFSSLGLFVKGTILSAQYWAVGLLITFRIALFTALISIFVFAYNQINEIIDLINDTLDSQDTISKLVFDLLNVLGVTTSFQSAFVLFSPVLISIFVLFLTKFSYKLIHNISNELFKIGVLLQQK